MNPYRTLRLMSMAVTALVAVSLSGCVTARAPAKPETLATLVAQKDVPYLLIDVRSPEEYAAGHIPTAVNIPLDSLPQAMPAISHDEVVRTYCNTGIMASMAADKLKEAGFSNVQSGSIRDWKGPLATGPAPQ